MKYYLHQIYVKLVSAMCNIMVLYFVLLCQMKPSEVCLEHSASEATRGIFSVSKIVRLE